ncbi:MAG TPA: hypothetical protein PKL85_01715 [Bacteroidia bacterium]|mgnify:CR=1 FL=1|nr:hypothetical protein [Bacteroidia bacterium]
MIKDRIFPFLLILCFPLIALMSSCQHKGCTNKEAINFDVTADTDDGTCIVCSTREELVETDSLDIVDNSPSSSHYQQVIAKAYIEQKMIYPSDGHCGNPQSVFSLKTQSRINQTMYIYYSLRPSTIAYFNLYEQRLFQPYETLYSSNVITINYPPFYPLHVYQIEVNNVDVVYY